jgi:hypothetical protein
MGGHGGGAGPLPPMTIATTQSRPAGRSKVVGGHGGGAGPLPPISKET